MQREEPLVSVITSVYNHQDYIGECIDSIANQTYPNIEIIVVDDGSSDNTYEVIKQTLKKHPDRFISVFTESQQNMGKALTLNKLIKKASGKYIYPVDSDDVAKPTAIQKEVEFLENNPDYVLVVGDDEFIDKDSKKLFYTKELDITYEEEKAALKTFADVLNCRSKNENFGMYYELLKGNHVPNGYLVRADILRKIEFTNEAPLEDYYMMLQLAKYGKFKYMDEVLLAYRRHSAGISSHSLKMIDITYKDLLYEKQIIIKEPGLDDVSRAAFLEVMDSRMKDMEEKRKLYMK